MPQRTPASALGKGHEEAVSAQLDLEAAVGLAVGAHDGVVVGHDHAQRHAVAQAFGHAGEVVPCR